MSAGHSHAIDGRPGKERVMWLAFGLTFCFFLFEVVGGIVTGSLALLSDAAHMFTDVAALAVSLAAIRIGRRKADRSRTFGYYRFEILAATFNAVLLFLVAIYILYEAYQRLQAPAAIESWGMLIVAVIGLVINLISMRLLSADKDESLNVKGAYLEVWSDTLGSVGVIVGALVIRWTGWLWVDSVVAVAIGLWVLPRTWMLLRESLNVLLEGVPASVDLDKIERGIVAVTGVSSIHDLHVWEISSGKVSLTAHLIVAPEHEYDATREAVQRLLKDEFHIVHVTLQCERTACEEHLDALHRYE